MEEIVNDLHQMWGLFWQSASVMDKTLAVSNVLGAIYTFVISFILFHKVDLVQESYIDLNINIVKSTLIIIMIGCFFAIFAVRVPLLYEALLSLGLTTLLTHLLRLTIKSEKKIS